MAKNDFLQAWERSLAFRGEKVEIHAEGVPIKIGQLEGLERDGGLRLRASEKQSFTVQFGEVHLRPVL